MKQNRHQYEECLLFATITRDQFEIGSWLNSGAGNSLKGEYAIPIGCGTRSGKGPSSRITQDDGPLPEYDIDDDRNSCGNTESELLVHTFLGRHRSDSITWLTHLQVTSSSPKSLENLQVWTCLYTMSDNSLVMIPPCSRSDKLRL